MSVEATGPQGRTAQEVTDEAVRGVAGLNPPRYTVGLDGEEALVWDGMPGQDAVGKVQIVHGGKLYTLTFSPYRSANSYANVETRTLHSSVPSWRL